MADLKRIVGSANGEVSERDGRGERDVRGQIILIAAFTLAVVFVALALVVNSAIYTENLASRGSTGGSSDALYLRHELEIVLGNVLTEVNEYNVSDHDSALETGVGNATYEVERQQALSGAYVNVSGIQDRDAGDRIVQNETTPREFTSESGTVNWQLANDLTSLPDVDEARAFEMTVQMSSLSAGSGGAYTAVVQEWDTTNNWTMQLYHVSGSPNEFVVDVQRPDGTSRQCQRTITDTTVHVDVTGGTVDGEPCYALRRYAAPGATAGEDLRFTTGTGTRYNVSFQNGDAAAGNYSMVVDSSVGGVTSSNLNSGGSRVSPYTTPGTYEFTVGLTYRSNAVTYETDVRIAPGEAT